VPGYTGRMLSEGQQLEIPVPSGAQRCSLIFWSHPWSGTALIAYGDQQDQVDLYSHAGGCLRHVVDCSGTERLHIRSLAVKRAESKSFEVIFLRAVFAGD